MWTSEAIDFLRVGEFPRVFAEFTFLRENERDLLMRLYNHPYDLFGELLRIPQLESVDEMITSIQGFAQKLNGHGFQMERALIFTLIVLNKLDACGFYVRGIVMLERVFHLTTDVDYED